MIILYWTKKKKIEKSENKEIKIDWWPIFLLLLFSLLFAWYNLIFQLVGGSAW